MIIFDNVTKVVGAGARKRDALAAVRATLPTDRRIAIFAPLPEDRKILLDLLSGLQLPTSGRVIHRARVSFPAGHLGGFNRDLSVRLNVAHVARLYGADADEIVDFVAQVTGLRGDFNK